MITPELIQVVSAHTGNDAIEHGFTLADGVIGIIGLMILIGIIVLIKKYQRKK